MGVRERGVKALLVLFHLLVHLLLHADQLLHYGLQSAQHLWQRLRLQLQCAQQVQADEWALRIAGSGRPACRRRCANSLSRSTLRRGKRLDALKAHSAPE